MYKFQLSRVLESTKEVIGESKREITCVDDWHPVSPELRQYRVLQHSDDVMSGEEYFRECPGGLARFVKLDRRRRKKYGFEQIQTATREYVENLSGSPIKQ